MKALPLTVSALYHLPGFYDPFSSMSHLLGAVLFFVLGMVLMKRGRGHTARRTALGIYSFACVLLMSMSGVYHMMVIGGAAHAVMDRLDHSAIFILIAGTFTPIHVILFRGWRRWGPLAFIWVSAATGITLKVIFFNSVPEWFGLGLYLLLGWFGLVSWILIVQRYGWRITGPLAWGAIAYTLGGITDFLHWPTIIPHVVQGHEVFHIAVLAGAFFHWKFIAQFAAGAPESGQHGAVVMPLPVTMPGPKPARV